MLKKVYFEVKYYTRLANWMFQYAAAKSLCPNVGCVAECASMVPLFKKGWPFEELEILEEIPKGAYVYEESPTHRFAKITFPEETEILVIRGYFQSEKYFDREIVRKFLGPDKDRVARMEHEYADLLSKPNVTGISVRRTDYFDNLPRHPFAGIRYYRDSLARLPDVKDFIVCSDDIAWCMRYFPKAFPDKNFFFVAGKPILDQLYIHSLCKNVILSNSTFSWWAAWLNTNEKKKVFAPSLWFGFEMRRLGVDWKDIYFDGTVIVNNEYDLPRLIQGYWCFVRKKLRIVLYKYLKRPLVSLYSKWRDGCS